ncbi:amino acid adenylation domain-containing protein [Streptomyces sp. NPDC006996]|uniref:amino acid adenylation domain-containing protein n=1 Tax=Streptomyces sp. NPDC006996 TaxID=3156908 RepID=UPI0033C37B7F
MSTPMFPLADSWANSPTYRRARLERDISSDIRSLIAAVALTVSQYTGAEETEIGCPNVRSADELVLTLLVVRLPADPSFAQALAAVDQAVAHTEGRTEAVTASRAVCVVASLGERNLGEVPLDRRHLRHLDRHAASSELCLISDSEACRLHCDYSVDAFAARTAGLTIGHIVRAIVEGRADPAKPVSEYDFADEAEREELLKLAEAEPPASGHCVHRRFTAQAAATPDRIAVVSAGRELTYGQIDRRSDRIAARLRDRGVKRGERVGLLMERSPELVIAMLGVLKAGCAYVPLDVRAPAARNTRIAGLAGLAMVLRITPGTTAPEGVRCEVFDAVDNGAVARVEDAIEDGTDSDDIAYVLFTSGSTGTPKGVAIRHRSVVRLFDATRDAFGFRPDSVWLNSAEATFDVSVWEIFGALVHGGRVVIAPRDVVRDPEALVRLTVASRVTILTTSPTAFTGFRDAALAADADVSSLRHIVFCAEALNPLMLEPWFERWPDGPELINMYGITEATVHSTFRRLTRNDARSPRSMIGRGLSDTPVYVLDGFARLAPFGMGGEIHVGGPGVAAGYLVAPEGDHNRFTSDPYSSDSTAVMYRSGDLGRLLADGTIEYLGRLDRQVKIRGYRIELGEVEAALLDHPGVVSARAWLAARDGLPPTLAMAIVTKPDDRHGPADWRAHAARTLPAYMVPSAWLRIDALPLTANGKLDTPRLSAALLEATSGRPADESRASDPADPRENAILQLMRTVLGTDRIGVEDGFFERGGDSITAIRLVAALRKHGFPLADVAMVYAHRNSRGLAKFLRSAVDPPGQQGAVTQGDGVDRGEAGKAEVRGFPATRLQRGMLLHSALDGEHVYHDVLSYVIGHAFDPERLVSALDSVVANNPVLRSSFLLDGPEGPQMRVHQTADVPCDFDDLRGLAEPDRDAHVEQWAHTERQTPFVLTEPGLLRLHVHRVADHESVLSLSVHHSIIDGWSAATFVSELLTAYADLIQGRETARKRDYGILERYARLEKAVASDPEQQEFWSDYVADAEPTTLPAPGVAGTASPASRTVSVVLVAGTVARIREIARSSNVPVKTVYAAAHTAALALAASTGQVVTGRIVNGRIEDEGGDETIGLFLNTVPSRISVGGLNWASLVRRVYEDEVLAAPYRRFPYERIQVRSGHSRLCPTAFNYTDFHIYRTLAGTGLAPRGVRYREDTDFAMLVAVHEDPHGATATLSVTVKTAEIGDVEARSYLDCLVDLLTHVDISDEAAVLTRALERAARRGGTLVVARGAAAVVPDVMALIEHRVRTAPDAIALSHAGRDWSFGQVLRQVQGIRRALADHGVAPGTRVACLLDRGVDPLVALLSVWAAGGVYVPMDPSLPEARLRTLFAMSGCEHTLVSEQHITHSILAELPSVVRLTEGASAPMSDTPASRPEPADEAYLLFTSGSTGDPKAVAMPHRAIANLIGWQRKQPEFAVPTRVSQFAPLAFDVSLQEMLTALVTGSTLVVPDDSVRRNPQAVLDFMADERIGVAFLPPVALRQLIGAWKVFGTTAQALDCVITAGEALMLDGDARAFFTATGAALVNQYGPTETHVVAAHRLTGPPTDWPKRPPIGLPVDNTELRVLGYAGLPVLRHSHGQLHVAGECVALGYADARAEAPGASDRFRHTDDGRLWYATGDLVRLGPDGLEFVGRDDDQIKIRGYRVEPAEVAAAILRHPGVSDCVVRVVTTAPEGPRALAAYVVGREATLTVPQVLKHAEGVLPEYAVPQFVEILERLPLTASGKTDVRALRPPRVVRARPSRAEPVSVREREVLEEWQLVIGAPVLSPTVTFFEAGGTSLLLLSLYLRLRSRFKRDFAMHELFRSPTVREFAAFLDTGAQASHTASDPADRDQLPAPAPRDRIAAAAALRLAARRRDTRTHD